MIPRTQLGLYDYVLLQDMFNPVARMRDYFLDQLTVHCVNTGLTWINSNVRAGPPYWNRGKSWSGAIYNNYINAATGEKNSSGNASIASAEGWNLRWANTLVYKVQGR